LRPASMKPRTSFCAAIAKLLTQHSAAPFSVEAASCFILLVEHDLFPKTGIHFSGSCS
jgi:hypothetical protein